MATAKTVPNPHDYPNQAPTSTNSASVIHLQYFKSKGNFLSNNIESPSIAPDPKLTPKYNPVPTATTRQPNTMANICIAPERFPIASGAIIIFPKSTKYPKNSIAIVPNPISDLSVKNSKTKNEKLTIIPAIP